MRASYLSSSPSMRALVRWLGRLKFGGIVPSPEAADLLGDRLAARRRARVWCTPAFVAAALALVYALGQPIHGHRDGSVGREWPVLLTYSLLSLSLLGWHELVCRFDRRTGARLPRRVTRPVTPTTRTVLGFVVAVGIGAAVAMQIVMGVVLFVQRVDAVAWVFAATCAVAWSVAAFGVARAVGRPTIAVDALTTAVDDRLRSGEAARACIPLVLATLAFTLSEGLSQNNIIFFLSGLGPVLVSSLISYGLHAQRWAPRLAWNAPLFTRMWSSR